MSDSQVTTLDDPVAAAPAAPASTKAKATTKAAAPAAVAEPAADGAEVEEVEKFYNVTIHPTGDESGSDVVEVGVNGYLTRLPRGVPCRVSAAVLHVLENAVVTSYKVNGDQVTERHVPRFPFSATAAE